MTVTRAALAEVVHAPFAQSGTDARPSCPPATPALARFAPSNGRRGNLIGGVG
jgi:hypothetical protein